MITDIYIYLYIYIYIYICIYAQAIFLYFHGFIDIDIEGQYKDQQLLIKNQTIIKSHQKLQEFLLSLMILKLITAITLKITTEHWTMFGKKLSSVLRKLFLSNMVIEAFRAVFFFMKDILNVKSTNKSTKQHATKKNNNKIKTVSIT